MRIVRGRWSGCRVALTLVLLLAGPGTAAAAGEEGVTFIGTDELRRMQTSPRLITIVDVRSVDEFRDSHIKSAVSIPLTELERRFREIPRQGLVVLY